MATREWAYQPSDAASWAGHKTASDAELRRLIAGGSLGPETMVWRSGMVNPAPLVAIPELAALLDSRALRAPSEIEQWFVADTEGKQHGPLSLEGLLLLADEGVINDKTLAWRPQLASWMPIRNISELASSGRFRDKPQAVPELPEESEGSQKASASELATAGKARARRSAADAGSARPASAREEKASSAAAGNETGVGKGGMHSKAGGPEGGAGQSYNDRDDNAGDSNDDGEDDEDDEERRSENAGEGDGKEESAKHAASMTEEERERRRERKRRHRERVRLQRDMRSAVYVSGLPKDVTADEIVQRFKVGGIIKKDHNQQPRIRIYRDDSGAAKGDAVVWYLVEDSVKQAILLLDGADLRPSVPIKVEKAMFIPADEEHPAPKRPKLDPIARAIARRVPDQRQELSWDDDGVAENPKKGLRIVILKNMFTIEQAKEEEGFYEALKLEVGLELERDVGKIEKITVFQGNAEGVIAVKFEAARSAQKCIEVMNGAQRQGRRVSCEYFDGHTNYKMKESEEETQRRLEEFAKWIES